MKYSISPRNWFAVLLVMCSAVLGTYVYVGVFAPAQAEEGEKKADPEVVDRFAVPEGDVEALSKFIAELREFEPNNPAESLEYRERAPKAMRTAAERIVKLEQDKTSETYLNAFELLMALRMQDMVDAPAAEKQAYVEQLLKHVNAKEQVATTDLQLLFSAAQNFEYLGPPELAAKLYSALGKAAAKSDNPQAAQLIDLAEGSARRLGLVGQPIELQGTTLAGEAFNIKSLKGKVVLIDFWATWCGPCIAELPNVLANYKAYKDRGFEVVGVSIDENRGALEEFVEERKIPWTTLHDTGESKDSAIKRYGINSIPQMILVGRDGNVVSLSARGEELDELLAKLIGPADEKSKASSGE